MNYPSSSSYLENIIIKKNENNDTIMDSKPQITTSGGFPLDMFSKFYGGNSQNKDGINKIGGLSIPIGLVMNPENKDTIRIKYAHETFDNHAEDSVLEKENIEGGSQNTSEIHEIDEENMNRLLNMVCNTTQSKK